MNDDIKPLEELGPKPEILTFFSDYMLRGVKNLNTKERAIYSDFLRMLIMQRYLVDPSRININDLVNANKPGAIIRKHT